MCDETNLVADVEPLEATINDCVWMKIYLLALAGRNYAIALLDKELKYAPVALALMRFDVTSMAPNVIFELAANRVETIVDRYVDVLMAVTLGRVPPYYDFSARNREVNPHVIEAALVMAAIGGFNHDTAAGDAMMELF
jgi:hypothetical protein